MCFFLYLVFQIEFWSLNLKIKNMKKSKLFYLLGIVVMAAALTFSSCKKDDEEPTPTPTPSAYTPVFSPTYLVVNNGGTELLDFYITCVTDDWEMIKCTVSYPGGLGSDVFVGNGAIVIAGSPFTFSQYFVKLGGTWTFTIVGNIKSGAHLGESFTVVTSVTVTGK